MLEGPSYGNRLCVGSTVLRRERGQGQPGVSNGVFPEGSGTSHCQNGMQSEEQKSGPLGSGRLVSPEAGPPCRWGERQTLILHLLGAWELAEVLSGWCLWKGRPLRGALLCSVTSRCTAGLGLNVGGGLPLCLENGA